MCALEADARAKQAIGRLLEIRSVRRVIKCVAHNNVTNASRQSALMFVLRRNAGVELGHKWRTAVAECRAGERVGEMLEPRVGIAPEGRQFPTPRPMIWLDARSRRRCRIPSARTAQPGNRSRHNKKAPRLRSACRPARRT